MATALELGREGWQRYLHERRRRAPPKLLPEQQREHLLAQARQAAAMLKSEFGAKRVVLFGSLAHGAWFTPDSDVDMAVEGLSGERYWQAWRAVEAGIAAEFAQFIH
ncbi:MAG: nucleotidyltransferase family protein [Anaerolineae bacterium]